MINLNGSNECNGDMNNNFNKLNKDQCQDLMNLLSKFNDENLLLKRLVYKVKNQMHKNKQFKYLLESIILM